MLKTISSLPIGTGFLAFRDLGTIVNKYIKGVKALDFGCGAGRSSRILKELGLNVIGVDTSIDMIDQARNTSKDINYFLIEKNCFKSLDDQFDLIFVSFVLMELSSKQEIKMLIKDLSNLLAENGKIILIVASDDLYNKDWLSIDTKFHSNSDKNSGEIVSVYLSDYGITVNDYLWKESDCEECFKQSNMLILEKLTPLGLSSDGKDWIDEYTNAPFVIYVLSK
tara:strand:+ start:1653 stop:2324 length:672 start_codon:yes stop_codon:yes gene_type:complete